MQILKLALSGMVALFIIAILLILMACQPQVAQAATMPATPVECQLLADGVEYRVGRTISLSERVPEQASHFKTLESDGAHTFQQANTLVVLAAGEQVLLSGSPEGSGFVADDRLEVSVQPTNATRTWDFRNPERTQIVPIETPQEMTDLFQTGSNLVSLSVKDLMGPVYSSSDYWLLILEPCVVPLGDAPMLATALAIPEAAVVSSPPTATTAPTAEPTATSQPPETPMEPTQAITETLPLIERDDGINANASDPSELVASGPAIASTLLNEREAEAAPLAVAEGVEPTATVQSVRRPLLWSLGFGLPLGLLLVGLALWKGRRFAPELWDEAHKQLTPLLERIQREWREVKARLEAMQQP